TSLNSPKKPNSLPFSSDRQRQRYLPPGCTSISHTGIDQPGGPSIHFCTSFGTVCASHTSLRGAWKERLTRTSVSLGSETSALNFSVVIMAVPFFVFCVSGSAVEGPVEVGDNDVH